MPVLEGKPWKFEQLGHPYKVLELSGWAAPFGGPRVEAVVKTPIRARTERVFYPGSKNSTRHVFGVHFPNWELKGRFRDRARPPMGGAGFAKAKTEEAEAFVADLQQISISWGDILYAPKAFLVEFEPGWEGEGEVEWILRAEIDEKEISAGSAPFISAQPPEDHTAAIVAALNATEAVKAPPLSGDLLTSLALLVDAVTGPVGQLAAAAENIQSFKDSTFAQLNRLQATIATVGRAARVLRETFASIPQDAVTLGNNADASITLLTSQTTVEEQLLEMLSASTRLERSIELARAGRARGSHIARTGDTWESISAQYYGRPDRAGDIRELNGIAPGAAPVPGAEYLLPK